MNRSWKSVFVSLIFAATLGLAATAYAGDAQNHVQKCQTDLHQVLRSAASPARAARLATMIDAMIDYDKLANDSLGRHRSDRTEAEMTEFKGLLQKLVRRNYERNIQKTLNYTITYTGESGDDNAKIVTTSAVSNKPGDSKEPVTIDYKLHKKDGKWMIYDIVTERTSILNSYKNQFNKTITNDGWGKLIKKLDDKVKRGG